MVSLEFVVGDAIVESGDDPEVIRAKYFIRDEFLVNIFIFYQLRYIE